MRLENPKNLIRDVLKKHPEGLTISSIAQMSGLHRHTSRKYINELTNAGEVVQRLVGAAKLCYLNCASNENKTAEKRSFFDRFNFKLVFSVVLITFLLSEAVILAYENNSFNETMTNNYSNTSPITASMILNDSNVTQIIETTIENASNTTVETNDSLVPVLNVTNESTNNTTISLVLNNSNISQIIDNISNEIENISLPIMNETVHPKFDTRLEYPEKITRGETFTVKIYVTNVGSAPAKNIVVNLQLPEGFEFTSSSSNCDVLDATSSCISEISVTSTVSANLGTNDLKVVINYEE
jgi:uncharacterized repeat protein (TIGR01451 family)